MNYGRIRTFIETEFEVSGQRAQGIIKNMSQSGIFVGTGSPPEQGENVQLSFKTPAGGDVSISGMVWWTTDDDDGKAHRTPGFGLRLLDESDEFRNLLENM